MPAHGVHSLKGRFADVAMSAAADEDLFSTAPLSNVNGGSAVVDIWCHNASTLLAFST